MIDAEYKSIIKAAVTGGNIVKGYFGKDIKVATKAHLADLRTNADLESEAAIIKALSEEFPTYNIISEEAGEINKKSDYTFVIDPLDGTNNFVLGIPYFSTSIALMKNDEVIFGAVYNPILNNLYCAQKGKGAYLNNRTISVNKETNIKNSTVAVIGFEWRCNRKPGEVKRTLNNSAILMDFCLLASGKIEAVLVSRSIFLHDFASGKIIAREAGALITDLKNKPEKNDKNDVFLVSNGTKIHKEILSLK